MKGLTIITKDTTIATKSRNNTSGNRMERETVQGLHACVHKLRLNNENCLNNRLPVLSRLLLSWLSSSLSSGLLSISLSLTRRSQEEVRSRTERENLSGREDCRSSVSGQCKTQEFSPLLPVVTVHRLSSLRRSASSPGPKRSLSCMAMPVTPTPPFAFPYLFSFVFSACAAAGAVS